MYLCNGHTSAMLPTMQTFKNLYTKNHWLIPELLLSKKERHRGIWFQMEGQLGGTQ